MAAPQWIDVSPLSFNVLMLLEPPHLLWFPRDWPGNELGIALMNPLMGKKGNIGRLSNRALTAYLAPATGARRRMASDVEGKMKRHMIA